MLHENHFQDKGNGFRYAHTKGIDDTVLMRIAENYKNGVSRKYKNLQARQLQQTFQGSPEVIASIKYDGEGIFLYYAEGAPIVAFNAPSGRARIGLPCLKALETKLKADGIKKMLATAEIYLRTGDGPKCRSGDVNHITATGTAQQREELAVAAYDIIMLDGKDVRDDQKAFGRNWDTIGKIFGTDTTAGFHRVEGEKLAGKEIETYFQKVTKEMGHEGAVIRYPSGDTVFKVKPNINIDTVVIGFVEGEFEGQYGVMSLLCGLCAPDGKTIQAFARVGSGFSDNLRASLLETLAPLKTASPIRMTDSDGRPITFVKPSLVVEIEGECLVEKNLQEKPTSSQTFEWDGAEFTFKGINTCPKLSHAVLHRIRDDKNWSDGGTRMEQVLGEKTIQNLIAPAKTQTTLHETKLREVFVKKEKSGGISAVRKILVLERNSPEFHRFTVHWTDFSGGRKDPFKNELAVADTQERMEAIVETYRTEANKRGWEKMEADTVNA